MQHLARPGLLDIPRPAQSADFERPDAELRATARSAGLIFSEFRITLALVDRLATSLAATSMQEYPVVMTQFPGLFSITKRTELAATLSREFPTNFNLRMHQHNQKIFGGFSRQLELSQTAALRELGDSALRAKYSSLIDFLRTHAEEAVLMSNRAPLAVAVEHVYHIRKECELAVTMGYWGGTLPSNSPAGFYIQEFDPKRISPDSAMYLELEKICAGLVCVGAGLEGLGRNVTADEIARDMHKDGARLFVPYLWNKPIGLYLIFGSPKSFPNEALAAIRQKVGVAKFPTNLDGWAKIVALSVEGREALDTAGFPAYRVLTSAVTETARAHGIDRLWGDIRSGHLGNTAIVKHVAVNWKQTGIFTEHDGFPYEILLLHPGLDISPDPRQIAWGFEHSTDRDWLANFNGVAGLYRDLSYCGLDSADRVPNFRAQRLFDTDWKASIERQINQTALHTINQVEGCHEIVVTFGQPVGRWKQLAIKQKVPGKDLWKLEETDYYLLGISQPMRSFSEIIKGFAELLRK